MATAAHLTQPECAICLDGEGLVVVADGLVLCAECWDACADRLSAEEPDSEPRARLKSTTWRVAHAE